MWARLSASKAGIAKAIRTVVSAGRPQGQQAGDGGDYALKRENRSQKGRNDE